MKDPRTDAELSVAKDDAAILERYKPFLSQQVRRFSKNGIESEDLYQEGAIALIKSFRKWKPEGGSSVLTWIHFPVINAMSLAVKRHRRQSADVSLDTPKVCRGPGMDGEGEVSFQLHFYDLLSSEENELVDVLQADRLYEAFFALPEREQQILTHRIEGETLEEIGERFNFSRERIRQIQDGALSFLRTRLSRPPRRLKVVK